MERLQKIIAAAGIASRRKAEDLIRSGRVAVNGKIVAELGVKADPERDHIRVDGKLLTQSQPRTYIALNKPRGYVTTTSDPQGRPTVMDIVRGAGGGRIYPVGRLDWNSEGLLLLTNDGDLAARLMRAASHVPKTYVVKVSGQPSEAALAKLRSGVRIRGRGPHGRSLPPVTTAPAKVRLAKDAPNPWYEITLTEGRNRQIHRMFEQIGHHVEKIKRISYGPLKLDLPLGAFRRLTLSEIRALERAAAVERPGTRGRRTSGDEVSTRRQSSAVIKEEAR